MAKIARKTKKVHKKSAKKPKCKFKLKKPGLGLFHNPIFKSALSAVMCDRAYPLELETWNFTWRCNWTLVPTFSFMSSQWEVVFYAKNAVFKTYFLGQICPNSVFGNPSIGPKSSHFPRYTMKQKMHITVKHNFYIFMTFVWLLEQARKKRQNILE